MFDFAIKFILLILFFGVMVGIGLYCRRHATDVSGFVLGGRSVGPWLTAFAYGTSYFSAVVFVGYAGQFGWKYGVAATWAGLGNAFLGSLLAWVVLGRRTRVMTQHLDSATMPEFFGKRFESQSLKLCASAIIFIFLGHHRHFLRPLSLSLRYVRASSCSASFKEAPTQCAIFAQIMA